MAEIDTQTVSIAAGQSLSAEIDIGVGKSLVGIQVPANWTTAGITFQASIDGGASWGEITQNVAGSAVPFEVPALTGGTEYHVAIDPTVLRGVVSLKVRSGSQGTPVNQVAQVTLTLVTKIVT